MALLRFVVDSKSIQMDAELFLRLWNSWPFERMKKSITKIKEEEPDRICLEFRTPNDVGFAMSAIQEFMLLSDGQPLPSFKGEPTVTAKGFPRFLQLFGYILPRETRERIYEPGKGDLLEDYLETRKKYRTKWSKRWLAVCFTIRTIVLFAGALRGFLLEKCLWLVPKTVRSWMGLP